MPIGFSYTTSLLGQTVVTLLCPNYSLSRTLVFLLAQGTGHMAGWGGTLRRGGWKPSPDRWWARREVFPPRARAWPGSPSPRLWSGVWGVRGNAEGLGDVLTGRVPSRRPQGPPPWANWRLAEERRQSPGLPSAFGARLGSRGFSRNRQGAGWARRASGSPAGRGARILGIPGSGARVSPESRGGGAGVSPRIPGRGRGGVPRSLG